MVRRQRQEQVVMEAGEEEGQVDLELSGALEIDLATKIGN